MINFELALLIERLCPKPHPLDVPLELYIGKTLGPTIDTCTCNNVHCRDPSPPLQVDNVPVEYAGEGGRSQEREGRGRRRPVGNSQHSDDEEEGGGGDSDPDEVTTKDSS